jgi:hypothetical protein
MICFYLGDVLLPPFSLMQLLGNLMDHTGAVSSSYASFIVTMCSIKYKLRFNSYSLDFFFFTYTVVV